VTRTGGALCASDERRQALLELADSSSREVWPVGERALTNGILLGRYERCDGHGSRILARRGISRVHALVVAVDGAICVLDLGSTNGTWLDGSEIRVARLSPGSTFRLGERGPSITFRSPQ
jgi:pSer/pThr/pTyr-binding forkhead associated (FHA) protein